MFSNKIHMHCCDYAHKTHTNEGDPTKRSGKTRDKIYNPLHLNILSQKNNEQNHTITLNYQKLTPPQNNKKDIQLQIEIYKKTVEFLEEILDKKYLKDLREGSKNEADSGSYFLELNKLLRLHQEQAGHSSDEYNNLIDFIPKTKIQKRLDKTRERIKENEKKLES